MVSIVLKPGKLSLSDLNQLMQPNTRLSLDQPSIKAIKAAEETVNKVVRQGKTVYGINTGFGSLADIKISESDIEQLQQRLILSHAAGTGPLLPKSVVRLILALKINSLARGYSGVSLDTVQRLITFFNEEIYPCIPAQGSVGASGDLAPLAHLSIALIGVGDVTVGGKTIAAKKALEKFHLKPLKLGPKEGLALVNGTQVSTALALVALFQAKTLLKTSLIAGALSVDAMKASDTPFDDRIQQVRGFEEQISIANALRELLHDSEIRASHTNCHKVQDAYSLRCQPQVLGACLSQLNNAARTLTIEANAVSDNPLVFSQDNVILSGGNFHAEPVAFAADAMALSIAEIGALSERRIALLIDPHFSGLPAFLTQNPGLNSGYMIPQVTAAALVSENKALAVPSSIDSIPTSANQEDHVSMATYAAKRLLTMTTNVSAILAIELLAACQGIDFLRPLKSSSLLEKVYRAIRKKVPYAEEDHWLAPDIQIIQSMIQEGEMAELVNLDLGTATTRH